ncbi:MAG: hypothetical protein Q9219_007047 [cf. Caloplaca sp. 3 TL-2023]
MTAHPGFFSPRPSLLSPALTDDRELLSAIDGLQRLSFRLAECPIVVGPLRDMSDFAQTAKSFSATMQSDEIFAKLQPMRAWLFWTPITLLSADSIRIIDLVVLAQLYTVALALDMALPELRGAGLGSLTAARIDMIDRRLQYEMISEPQASTRFGPAEVEEAMRFPRSLAARYSLESRPISDQPQRMRPEQQSPYLNSTPVTPGFSPGSPFGFPAGFCGTFPSVLNRSVEDLNTPASPFPSYGTPASGRQSPLIEASPSLHEGHSSNGRSIRGHAFHGDSPVFASSFSENDRNATFLRQSPASYSGEFVAPISWA